MIRPSLPRLSTVAAAATAIALIACARSAVVSSPAIAGVGASPPMMYSAGAAPPRPDPRVGLAAGRGSAAGNASWNMRHISNSPKPPGFGSTNSDLAFTRNYVIQGNYNGYQVWDVANPAAPRLVTAYLCPASQSDVSVYKNLIFVSAEAPSARVDCGTQGVSETISPDRLRGIRVIDATDMANPKYMANVQTCRGSHTHTLVSDPKDKENVYIYISGSSSVRNAEEMPGCVGGSLSANPNSAQFRIEVIQVPLARPDLARLVNSPHILANLTAPPPNPARNAAANPGGGGGGRGARGGGGGAAGDSAAVAGRGAGRAGRGGAAGGDSAAVAGRGGARGGAPPAGGAVAGAPPAAGGGGAGGGGRAGPSGCHDITTYPAIGLAGGACAGYGVILDISDVKNPKRIEAVADTNMSYWHSATFSNDGSKVLFSDEWGGGGAPRCRATDRLEWGANAIFTLQNGKMKFMSYFKMPAAQTEQENCVAHNGSLIPVPGRDIMVQSWYQGGINVFDWTDPRHAFEIAFFDHGPGGGSYWSAYWYNGLIYGSGPGLDIFELTPSGYLSQNEIDAAKTVILEEFNPQEQPKFVWPPSFALARAYLDQLVRNEGLSTEGIASARSELTRAEALSGAPRRDVLSALASRLNSQARSAADAPRVRLLSEAIRDLANSQR